MKNMKIFDGFLWIYYPKQKWISDSGVNVRQRIRRNKSIMNDVEQGIGEASED